MEEIPYFQISTWKSGKNLIQINMLPIGQLIINRRKELKISVPQLARLLKIPKDRIYKWEQGTSEPKHEDRLLLEKWLSGKMEDVPQGTQETGQISRLTKNEYEEPAQKRAENLSQQALYNMTVSDKARAEAELIREQNNKRIIEKLTASDQKGNLEALTAALVVLQRFVIGKLPVTEQEKAKKRLDKETALILSRGQDGPQEKIKESGSYAS